MGKIDVDQPLIVEWAIDLTPQRLRQLAILAAMGRAEPLILPGVILDDEARIVVLLDRSRWRKAL